MKHLQKPLTLLLALALILSLSVTGFAAAVTPEGLRGPASITVALPAIPEGTVANNTYNIYKVFDATSDGESSNISYTLVSGKATAPEGFVTDEAGNVFHGTKDTEGNIVVSNETELTADEITAIAAYVAKDAPIATVTTTASDTSFTVNGLPYGYYYITTTTGTVVTVDSTNPNAMVDDKNTVPELDKAITGADSMDEAGQKAIAQVGTDVTYTVTITVGKGAENYVFHDQMSSGLSYNENVAVTVGGTAVSRTHYNDTPAGDDTITIAFDNDYIATLDAGTVITITYSAKITSDALTKDPANNTAWLDYGENNSTTKDSTDVYNAKLTVTKQDGDKAPLEGAGFVLLNSEGKYYKIADGVVSWVDSIDDATEYESDAKGQVPPFTGLANGTYTLSEKTVPAGYNKAEDVTFTIEAGDFTAANLEQTATVVNYAGSELPSTGGMGTTIFYTVGSLLMIGAVVLLITKKRLNSAE